MPCWVRADNAVQIDLLVKGAKMEAPIDAEQLSAFIRQRHLDHVLSVNQVLVHEFQGYRLQTKVLKIELFSSEELAAMRSGLGTAAARSAAAALAVSSREGK